MADTTRLRGNQVLNGSFGTLWIDNVQIAEVKDIEAKVTADREDVLLGLSKDSKMVSLSGSGSLTLYKVYSRANDILTSLAKGTDKRVRLVYKIEDPDAVGGQIERVSIDNVWFNEIDVAKFARGSVVEDSYSFGFTPEDVEFEDKIS
jgi:hypothetical protein